MEYWQIVKQAFSGIVVYEYEQDPYDDDIFWYKGCVYKFNGKSVEEVLLKAAIIGNVRFFKLKKHNIAQGVVFKDNMEFLFE